MISHTEAQEMHECIGYTLESLKDLNVALGMTSSSVTDALCRARELAAIVVSDTAPPDYSEDITGLNAEIDTLKGAPLEHRAMRGSELIGRMKRLTQLGVSPDVLQPLRRRVFLELFEFPGEAYDQMRTSLA